MLLQFLRRLNFMDISSTVENILERIANAADKSGRDPGDISLVAVSKGQSAERINEVCSILNHFRPCILGENYIQEFSKKRDLITVPHLTHFIGNLQSNKTKQALQMFDVIQSVSSKKLATTINKSAERLALKVKVFLQVNISDDDEKGGFQPIEALNFIKTEALAFKALEILGLMTITRFYPEPERARPDFQAMKKLKEQVLALENIPDSLRDNNCALSMGMSQDFEIAIEEGASIVRIGTALFGERG